MVASDWRGRVAAIAALLAIAVLNPSGSSLALSSAANGGAVLHYASNDNFGRHGRFDLRRYGYTLADVSSPSSLRRLPKGIQALVYLGLCGGNTRHFRSVVNSYLPGRRVYGFYLEDMPDPHTCPPANLAAESTYIHRHVRQAVTFIVLLNMSSSEHPTFLHTYTPANSKINLYGLAPYPCRTELHGCNYSMINRYVNAAQAAGIPRSWMVPMFQAFGGGQWQDDGGGQYQLPTAAQARVIICRWHRLIKNPPFDYAYSWGVQQGDTALANAPAKLRDVFVAHNAGHSRC